MWQFVEEMRMLSIMMHALCSLFLRQEMRTQAKHSNVSSFDHDACMVEFVFEARKDPKQRDLNHQDQYHSTRTREDEQDEEK